MLVSLSFILKNVSQWKGVFQRESSGCFFILFYFLRDFRLRKVLHLLTSVTALVFGFQLLLEWNYLKHIKILKTLLWTFLMITCTVLLSNPAKAT